MNKFFDIVIPRFLEEEIKVKSEGENWVVLDDQNSDDFTHIIRVDGLNFFGLLLFPKVVSEMTRKQWGK